MNLMKIRRWISALIFSLLLLGISLPRASTIAQSDAQNDDFIVTLALMAVADDRLDGIMDASALSDIRAELDDYYTQQSYLRMDNATSSALLQQKKLILAALDTKIDKQKTVDYRGKLAMFIDTIDSVDDTYKKTETDSESLLEAWLFKETKPDPYLRTLLSQRLAADTQSALVDNLNGQVIAKVPNGADLVSQTTDQIFDINAGMPDPSNEPPTIVGLPLVFFNFGDRDVRVLIEYYEPPLGLNAYAPGLNLTVKGNSSVQVDGFPQGNYVFCYDWETDSDTDGDWMNDYDRAVIHTWLNSAVMDNAFHAGDVYVDARYSETPSGLCDGFKGEAPSKETVMKEWEMWAEDMAAMITSKPEDGVRGEAPLSETEMKEWEMWAEDMLSIMAPQLMEGAITPTESVSSPIENEPIQDNSSEDGDQSSGGDFWDQDDGNSGGTGLTAAELANQGTHQYQMTCENEGQVDTRTFSATWTFSASGVTGGNGFYARVGANIYRNDYPTTITFTSGGYLVDSYYTETSSEGVTTTSLTHCTATIQ